MSVFRAGLLVALVAAGLQLAVASAASAAIGPGQMSVSPKTVLAGSTGNKLAFTYTASSAGFKAGTVKLQIPIGWSAPHKKAPAIPGKVKTTSGEISVSGMTVSVTNLTLCASCSATISYADATAQSTSGPALFAASATTTSGRIKPIIDPPHVLVEAAPSAPTITSIQPAADQLNVSWSQVTAYPAVTDYTVTCGSISQTTPGDPADLGGLAGGTPVNCSVYATNPIGNSPSSPPVSATPDAAELGPVSVTSVVPGDGQLTVNYTAPSFGDGPVVSYTATCGGTSSTTVSGATLSATVTGLTNGTDYSCTIYATSPYENGESNGWSGYPGPPIAAPTITSVNAQHGQLTILIDPLDPQQFPTSYTGTCGDQSVTVNSNTTWITIGGLSDGTTYSCTVSATNAAGTGPTSSPTSGTPEPISSSPTSSAGGQFIAVSCPTTTQCVAVGAGGTSQQSGLIEVSNDGGATFTNEAVPDETPALQDVTCLNARDCMAVGGTAVLITSDGGTNWSSEYAGGPLASVACINSTDCVAVRWTNPSTLSPAVMTSDGGLTWQAANGYPLEMASVTCFASTCVGVGPSLGITTDMGQSWQEFGVEGGVLGALTSVSCFPATTTCIAVGPNAEGLNDPNAPAQAFITTDAGQTWNNISSRFPLASSTIRALSCPDSETCYAAGYVKDVGASTHDGGETWTSFTDPSNVTPPPRLPPESGNDLGGDLSCASPSTCVMVGYNSSGPAAAFTTDSAVDWTQTSTIG
jgi:photosystem II stability/assembly factor-like uncharacterized protein